MLALSFSAFETPTGHRAHAMEVRSKPFPSLSDGRLSPYDVLSLAKAQTDPALLKLRLLKEHGHGQHEGTHPQE
jgi:hypothetical protein